MSSNSYWFYKRNNSHLKLGDYFYLDDQAMTTKLIAQEIINIKLGIKNVIPEEHWPTDMYQVIKIIKDKLFYNPDNIIPIKLR